MSLLHFADHFYKSKVIFCWYIISKKKKKFNKFTDYKSLIAPQIKGLEKLTGL